jgi:hypothetical protein
VFTSRLRDGDEIRVGNTTLVVGIRETEGEAERRGDTERIVVKLPAG